MFYIDKNTELTSALLQKMLNRFNFNYLPNLEKWKNYFDGKHAILNKTYTDENKPCNRIITNYCRVITETYSGYLAGKPITYTSNNDIGPIQEVINYNDDNSENISWLTNALIYSVGYELTWLDKNSQVRYSQISPLNAFPIYSNTLEGELLYFVRWYKNDNFDDTDLYHLEVYSANSVKHYRMHGLLGNLEFIEEVPHYFKDVPVSVFNLNENNISIFDSIITLNDAYNELQSSEVDEWQEFVDSYLSLTGCDADEEDIKSMKENRVLLLPEGSSAGWVTKSTSDQQIENMLSNIRKNIFKVAACPDMSDSEFMAQSGVAIAYKIVNFENAASSIVSRFEKAIQRRLELICNIINIKGGESTWRDVRINFVRNLPVNTTEVIQLVNSLQGIVSNKTLLSQIPFVDDVDAELEAVAKQKEENMSLYSFGLHEHTEEDPEEEDEEI